MTELEKLNAGLPYNFMDPEVDALKLNALNAVKGCEELNAKERRNHIAVATPVTIGNDVWIGGNVTILPGVNIGDKRCTGQYCSRRCTGKGD